jgi:hypothetical protein
MRVPSSITCLAVPIAFSAGSQGPPEGPGPPAPSSRGPAVRRAKVWGAKARMKRISPEERRRIARKAIAARWARAKKKKLGGAP